MLVRSQNKKELLAFGSFIILSPTKKKPTWGIGCITTNSQSFLVAEYSTEDKAIKVINMLEEYVLGRSDRNSALYRELIFHFPKDEDVKV